jgi:hypothetical protein
VSLLPLFLLALIGCYAGQTLAQQTDNAPKLFGYARLIYVADDKKGGRLDQSTPGFGGKLGLETPSVAGLSIKAAAYTTSDLGLRRDDPRRTDAYMFDLDKKPYSLLGEAQINYRHGETTLIAGRQEFFSPIINSYEYRIIPNLFEAVTLKVRLADSTVTLAFVSKMSGLDSLVSFSEFRSMSQQAYVSLKTDANGQLDATNGETLDLSTVAGHRGVWVAGIADEKSRFQLWNFYGVDTVNTTYLDGKWPHALTPELTATVEAQAYRVADTGHFREALARQGLNARYALLGLKGVLAHRPSGMSLILAANRFTGDRNTVTSFGNWGGYPEYVSMPYLFAESSASPLPNSHLAQISLLFDLTRFGLKDQTVLYGYKTIDIDESLLAASDIKINTLLYRAKITPQLSARIALEARRSRNARYDNSFAVLGLRYDF